MPRSMHTPAPWVRDGTLMGGGHLEIDLRLDAEGENWVTVKGDNDAVVEANSRVIGVAPDMLAALHGLLAVENKAWPAYVRQAFANARKVVQKAEVG